MPKSLAAELPWREVLRQLGSEPAAATLPATATCPCCRRTLVILVNPRGGGQWYFCGSCHKSGDLLQLAERAWGLSTLAAGLKLAAAGVGPGPEQWTPARLADYEQHYRGALGRAQELWNSGQNTAPWPTEAAPLARQLRLDLSVPADRWEMSVGELVRIVFRPALQQALADTRPTRREQRLASAERRLLSTGAGPLLVIPAYSAPGQLCGFHVGGDRGKGSRPFFAVPAVPYLVEDKITLREQPEGGLSLHPLLWGGPTDQQPRLLVLSDVWEMLRWQLRHWRLQRGVLPLAAWQDDPRHPTRRAWAGCRHWQLALQGKLSPPLLQAAIATGAQIVHFPRDSDSPRRTAGSPREQLRACFRQALDWPDYWNQVAGKLSPTELEDFLLRFTTDPVATERLWEASTPELRRRWEANQPERPAQRQGAGLFAHVLEEGDAWYAQTFRGDKKLICEAVLRIETIVCYGRQDRSYCCGAVLYRGRRHEFCVPYAQLRRPLEWMRKFLLSRLEPGLLAYDPAWQSRILGLAVHFHRAQTMAGVERVGWAATAGKFILPEGEIGRDGIFPQRPVVASPEPLPAHSLRLSGESLQPSELIGLAEANSGPEFWGVLAALAAGILSPAVAPGRGHFAVSGSLETIKQLVDNLGCQSGPLSQAAAYPHAWPIWLTGPTQRPERLGEELLAPPEDRSYWLPLSWSQSLALQIAGNWQRLAVEENVSWSAEQLLLSRRVLPEYLADVCRRELLLAGGEDWPCQVLTDLARWLSENCGLEADWVLLGREYLGGADSPVSRAAALGELLARSYAEGILSGENPVSGRRRKGDLQLRFLRPEEAGCEGLFLGRQVLAELLARQRCCAVEPAELTAVLRQVPACWLEEGEFNQQPGWLLRLDWWRDALRRWRQEGEGSLRIA